MTMAYVVVDDGNGREFEGMTKNPSPNPEEHVPVWAFIDGENGFGKNIGEFAMLKLKRADNGKFVA